MTRQELEQIDPDAIIEVCFTDGYTYLLEDGYSFDIGEDAGGNFGLSLHVWDITSPASWIPCGMWYPEAIKEIKLNVIKA